jgi:hypothetical protein
MLRNIARKRPATALGLALTKGGLGYPPLRPVESLGLNHGTTRFGPVLVGMAFMPKREKQRHCSRRCRVGDAVKRHRSDYTGATPSRLPEKRLQAPQSQPGGLGDGPTMVWPERPDTEGLNFDGSTCGALQGDDYHLEYYEDGYPKLPECLDRRPKPEPLAEAA